MLLTTKIICDKINPIRYRGYFYDTETGLYFLKSRYYDPETGRFISPDAIEYADPDTINGLNLYSYCGNNPVMNVDPDGHLWWVFVLIGAAIGFGATVVADYADDGKVFNGSITARDYVLNTITMAVVGGITGGLGELLSAPTIGGYALAGSSMAISTTTVGKAIATAIGAMVVFASNSRPGDNKKQNEQFRSVMKKLGYEKSDWQWRFSHDNLPKEKLGYRALLDYIVNLLNRF